MRDSLTETLRRFRDNRDGGQAIEYGLIVALIVIGIIAATNSIGESTGTMYNNLVDEWGKASK